MTRTTLALALASAAASAYLVATALPDAHAMLTKPSPIGTWIDHKGQGAVEISQCGNALCGKIVWLRDASAAEACGAPIIHQVADQGDGTYDKGYLYDIERNALYHLMLTPKGDTLDVHAYIMENKFLGRTMVFKRAPADLVKCAPTRTFDVTQLPDGVEVQ